jgi:uracil-DNA glycosylase
MPRRPPVPPIDPAALPLAKPVDEIPLGSIDELRRSAASCRACPLWRPATQTVFGEGPDDAMAMLIGEQPGNQEDLDGSPFVGPAGQLLDRALAEAGITRDTLYLTNTVKHFKFEVRGKVRLHQRANASEQAACRMWLAAELARVQPRLVVCLGAMAAQTVFGASFRVTKERGRWIELINDVRGLATWHPAAVLRTPGDRRAQAYAEFAADLALLAKAMRGKKRS